MEWEQMMEQAEVLDFRPPQSETKHPLPFPVYVNMEMVSREYSNPYSGQTIKLDPESASVYEVTVAMYNIAMAEGRDDPDHWAWDYHRKGIKWMMEYYTEAYMVLLD